MANSIQKKHLVTVRTSSGWWQFCVSTRNTTKTSSSLVTFTFEQHASCQYSI